MLETIRAAERAEAAYERKDVYKRQVMALPEKQAKRIYARYYLGMRVSEIATAEGVDQSRVRDLSLIHIFVGVVTVFLAAQSPAKRAAKVSPISAVSGNVDNKSSVKHAKMCIRDRQVVPLRSICVGFV